MSEFTYNDLLGALGEEFPKIDAEDTGGGCIALLIRKTPEDAPVSLGPGWFEGPRGNAVLHFRFDDLSVCTEDEIGPEWSSWRKGGDNVPFPDVAAVAEAIRTAHALYNNGRDHWGFTAEDILSRVREEFPGSSCDQTGGGTATLNICKDANDPKEISVLAGPGQFHWNSPSSSTFHTGEFSAGMDYYINGTDELRDPDETGPAVPIGDDWIPTPENLDNVARLIREYHGIYNNGSYPN